jgi:hypothetical protein
MGTHCSPVASYDGYKRKRGSQVHMAVDTQGHLLAVHVTPADEHWPRLEVHNTLWT